MASSAGSGVEVNFPFADSNSLLHGGYGGSGSGGNGFKLLQDYNTPASSAQPPWMVPMPSTACMSKALADLAANQQQMPKEQPLSSFLASSPMPSFGRFAPTSHVPPFPLSLEAQQSFRHTNRGYGGQTRQFPLQYVGNGGSLVLDRARGELINLSKMTPQEILDAKAIAASKSHSEAERRRRERINNHLATLRSLLPSTTKTDKASLLAEVIEHVKELKRQAAEIAEGGPVPTDVDELKVDSESGEGNVVLRASLCCDDRPNLLSDLTKAIKSLKLKTLKAEFATLGGRVKNVILLTNDPSGICTSSTSSSSSDNSEADQSIPSASSVQEALRAVIERSAELTPANGYGGNKRQKLVNEFSSTY